MIEVANRMTIDLEGTGSTEMWTTSLETDRWDKREWTTVDIPANAAMALSFGDSTLVALTGDITEMPVTVIVNAANVELDHGAASPSRLPLQVVPRSGPSPAAGLMNMDHWLPASPR